MWAACWRAEMHRHTPRVHSLDDYQRFVAKDEPCVFERYLSDISWDPHRIADAVGPSQLFEVAFGVEEYSGVTTKRRVTLNHFVGQLEAANAALDKTPESRPDPHKLLYLKQNSELLRQCPALWRDIEPVCQLLNGQYRTPFFWMGGAGCVTGLHSDDEHNVLLQVWGTKSVTLFSPELLDNLYPNSKYDSGTTCCDLDPLQPDLLKHPKASVIFEQGKYQRALLRPGDVLYCPRGWFHHVLAETASVSVNVFASSFSEWVRFGIPRKLLEIAHEVGLVGNGNCVCHASSEMKRIRSKL